MTIPECREALLAIANSLAAKGLADEARGIRLIVKELWRRPAVRVSRAKADQSTRKLRAKIRAYAAEHPDMLNREIGLVFNIDGGRVSEALAGFRKMSDIAIEFRVKNKRLKDAIFKAGWPSYAQFAKANHINYPTLIDLLGMRMKACKSTGWRKTSIEIATALHCEPEDLWPNEMAHAALTTNSGEFSISLENAMSLTPSARIDRQALGHLLEGISLRDAKVLTAVARGETYDQVGEHFQVTRERARQIHMKALKRLQGRARFRGIKYTDIVEEP